MNTGRLYVFEGCDGGGKTTLAKGFCELMRERKQQSSYFAFPGQADKTLGKHVYQLHHDPRSAGIERVHPASLQILHLAAHIDAIESAILPALKQGNWVVLDRYWWSTWVYGIRFGVDHRALKMMIQLELLYWSGTVPTALFLIERDPIRKDCESIQRRKITGEYNRLAKSEGKKYAVHKIRNDRPVELVLNDVIREANF